MAIAVEYKRMAGSSVDKDRVGYYYKVSFDAGDVVYMSFPYAASWGNPVWQITPAEGASVSIKGTNALIPVDADWIDHSSHPSVTAATADTESLAARHLRFEAAGGSAVLHFSGLQAVKIGDAIADLSVE